MVEMRVVGVVVVGGRGGEGDELVVVMNGGGGVWWWGFEVKDMEMMLMMILGGDGVDGRSGGAWRPPPAMGHRRR